jgi:hypothetical protein
MSRPKMSLPRGGNMAQPLSKTKEDDGTRYTRFPEVEAAIDIALRQDIETISQRARIRNSKSPQHMPSECLVHLIRHARRGSDDHALNTLLPLLLERCHANLNKKVDKDIPNAAMVRRDILRDFSALFAIDGSSDDKLALDFFEVRFNLAFARFRDDRVGKVIAQHAREVELPSSPGDTVEQEIDNEVIARLADLNGSGDLDEGLFRKQVIEAVKALPPGERDAVLLVHYHGFQIGSDTPSEVTAATLCNVDRRTIQNRLTRGLAKLSKLREQA